MRRLNKEYKLNISDKISIKYGTVNKDKPNVIYISGKCWVKTNDNNNITKNITYVKKEMENEIKTYMCNGNTFQKKYIIDFDINTDGWMKNIKKFLTFDIFIRQNDDNILTLKQNENKIKSKMTIIINNLINNFNQLNFEVTNKK